MAYARKRRYATRRRRVPAKRAVSRRYTRKRYSTKRMSTKRVLNISSIKKSDSMPPVVINSGGTTPGPITVGTGFESLFTPSARAISLSSIGESRRQRQTTYSVGYKERVSVAVTGGGSWMWRRIVFCFKGNDFISATGARPTWSDSGTAQADSMRRAIVAPGGTQQPLDWSEIIFDGSQGSDWTNRFTAKVDTKRVSLLSDKTMTLSPGTESGMIRMYRFWDKTGKNLVYNEDESDAGAANYLSVRSKEGMGDLYVYDFCTIIVPAAAGNAQLSWSPEGTYYWHEK